MAWGPVSGADRGFLRLILGPGESLPLFYIHMIDDGLPVALARILEPRNQIVRRYGSFEHFVDDYDAAQSGCVLLHAHDDMEALAAAEGRGLASRCQPSPLMVIADRLEARTVVALWRADVFDCLLIPFNRDELAQRLSAALEECRRRRERSSLRDDAWGRLSQLTPREREVMRLMVVGLSSKAIAARLGTSIRTIEVHRRRVMNKTNCGSLPDLVLLAIRTRELDPYGSPKEQVNRDGFELKCAA